MASAADAMLRPAHDAAYRFPPHLAGFTANLLTHAGDAGTVTIGGPRDVSVVLPDGAADADWVRGELSSMVAHRWSSEYADGDGRWAKVTVGSTVRFTDDPFDSAYKVVDGHIAEVHRTAGDARFAIVVHERQQAHDDRLIPVRFTVFHWAVTDGRLLRADHYRDEYALVDGVHLPAAREVTSAADGRALVTRRVALSDHKAVW